MKKVLYLTALLIISQLTYSQSGFRPGFIIKQKGDSIHGMVKYREGKINHLQCEFKENDSQGTVSYSPAEIYAYGFDNDKFFRSFGSLPGEEAAVSVFLEVLIKGKVSLYKYDKVFYVEKDGYGLLKLVDPAKVATDGAENPEGKRTPNYRGVLSLLLADSPQTGSLIAGTTLSEKALSDLIEKYNIAVNAPLVVYKADKQWFTIRYGVEAGLISSNVVLKPVDGLFIHFGDFSRANSIQAGATFDFLFPRLTESLSVTSALLVSKMKSESYDNDNSYGRIVINSLVMDITTLRIPVGLRYTFRGEKLAPYLDFGFSETFTLDSKSSWTQDITFTDMVNDVHTEPVEVKKARAGFWGGAGIIKPLGSKVNLNLGLRFETTTSLEAREFVSLNKSGYSCFMVSIGLTTK